MGPSFNDFPHVFTPVQIGPIRLKNRIQFSPMVSAHASTIEGYVTEGLVDYVEAQAASGVGLVTIGSSPVNHEEGRDFLGCLSVVRDEDIPGLTRLAQAAHRYGAKISCELIHAGRISRTSHFMDGPGGLVPSIIDEFPPNRHYHEVTVEQLQKIKQDFVNAALRLKAAGFDMVMIHGAHGNLMSAFLSPRYNKRTDQYGGSRENRWRFPLEVCQAIREAIGPNMAIEYRISSYEYVEDCPTVDDVADFLKEASKYIDLANLSGGLICDPFIARFMMPSYMIDRNVNVERTAYIRSKLDIPVTALGNIPDMYAAEEIIAEGKADVVAMARNIIADMDYVNKAYRNQADDIRPCLHCNICCTTPGKGIHMRCVVNPTVARETKYRFIQPARTKKKVMIVGGGIAGMQAAQTACLRGHDVVLYEQDDKLGGRLWEASRMWTKDYFRRYLTWDIKKTEESGARIVLGTKVTPEIVKEENPDALIIAIGAEHRILPIKGIDGENVINISEADLRAKPIGQRVVICGGGTSAVECGIDLAHEGHDVTILEMNKLENQMGELAGETKWALVDNMGIYGVKYIDQAKVAEIGPNYVAYETADGIQQVEADTIVASFGLVAREAEVEELQFLLPETYVVGDARQARSIQYANHDAFDVAVEI